MNRLERIALVFLASLAFNWQGVEGNPASRMSLLSAMSQKTTFRIDEYYQGVTEDWARTPDGHTYSNKAPGPALIAYPFAWVWDHTRTLLTGTPLVDHEPRSRFFNTLVCWITQVIPLLLVWMGALQFLRAQKVSEAALTWMSLSLLFGSTLSSLLGVWFGHATAAAFLLASLLALMSEAWLWFGFCLGWALLSDYGCFYVLPAFLVVLGILRPRVNKALLQVFLGGVVPGILWALYHWSCFGGVFTLPFRFSNPAWVEGVGSGFRLFGMATPLPDARVLGELIWGMSRGLLFTQPWVLVLLGYLIFARGLERRVRAFLAFGCVGFLGLFWMNASFNGWHGGLTPGPRYLSPVFPVLSVAGGLVFDRMGKSRSILWVGLVVALCLHVLVYACGVYAPPFESIWSYYLGHFFERSQLVKHLIASGAVGAGLVWIFRARSSEVKLSV